MFINVHRATPIYMTPLPDSLFKTQRHADSKREELCSPAFTSRRRALDAEACCLHASLYFTYPFFFSLFRLLS